MHTRAWIGRYCGIAAGISTHLLFAFTVWHLFWFLKGNSVRLAKPWLWVDTLLALQFAVPHSVFLLPSTRRRVGSMIGAPFYGIFFCAVTCISLLVLFSLWRTSAVQVWVLGGAARACTEAAFIASWFSLLYSIRLTGFGYQTGWTPWWHWVRRRKLPPRGFATRGAYRWLRHPVYLSFLGLIWFNPRMSADRLLLACTWTLYIFIGSHLKDERLAYYLGASYRKYQTQVAGYPFFFFGPLAKRKPTSAPIEPAVASTARASSPSSMAA